MELMKNAATKEQDPEMKKAPFPKVAEYDPNKKYKWTPNDTFVLTGNDFGLVLNTLRALTSAPIGLKTLMMAAQANEAMEVSLKAAVELGIVVESKDDIKPKQNEKIDK